MSRRFPVAELFGCGCAGRREGAPGEDPAAECRGDEEAPTRPAAIGVGTACRLA